MDASPTVLDRTVQTGQAATVQNQDGGKAPILTENQDTSSRNADNFYETTLGWIWFQGSAPSGAVPFWNAYGNRWEYPCMVAGCSAGYYSPSYGPYCFYPYGNKEYNTSKFWMLVNGHHFESLGWKADSYGGVPSNSINTCAGVRLYVGKNKYGLGKVDSKNKAFFLGYQGKEYWYKYYDVLTINKDYRSQRISNVSYMIEQGTYSTESMLIVSSKVSNNECTSVKKSTTLSGTVSSERHWDVGIALSRSVNTSMTAGIPQIIGASWSISAEKTFSWNQGSTQSESITYTETVDLEVPPNHSCEVVMKGKRMKANIPFMATATRYYYSGEKRMARVQGTSDNIAIAQVHTEVMRCEPIPNANPCAAQY
ncbi:Natterin-3 [Varanus komodoensis]|uniref:natterin-3-like n=1 Tax=Varanus komodoensis TaxID=61221 RepID=UPI001CF7A539|nr:natterin-3-like [Varanus komodoensis]KAF7239748.1 Natterin-3 [Varanus komodoensis]